MDQQTDKIKLTGADRATDFTVGPSKHPDSAGHVWSRHEIASWLAEHSGQAIPPTQLISTLCERLLSSGFPIFRAYATLRDLHPQILARTFTWQRDKGSQEIDRFRDEINSDGYLESPVYALNRSGASGFRQRLDIPGEPLPYPVLSEIRDEGATDYVAMPLQFTDGSRHFWSWATDAPGGFTTDQLTFLYDLMPLICLRLELENSQHVMQHLLATYLGADAATRVIGGSIDRGQGEEIDAIVFFSDLRGFTRLADAHKPADVVRVLSAYYESMAMPVQDRGGDVLKLVGDGLLAIFPINSAKNDIDTVGCRAITAARDATRRLEAVRTDDLPDGVDELRAGIALHRGKVTYGNVGAQNRLDFTVIGPAVNEAVRVEELSKRLERKILVTSAFADLECTDDLLSLGFHALRGVREPKEIFTLADI